MRKLLFTLPISMLITCCTGSGDQSDVEKTIVDTFEALSARDVDKMKDLCTKDVIILENGVVWNLDSITTNMMAMPEGLERVNSFEFIRTDISGNTAWVAYRNQADVTLNEKKRRITWMESATLKNENGTWKLQLLHSTVLERKVLSD